MAHFTLAEIEQATGGKSTETNKKIDFTDVSTDSRFINKGSLFVALQGEKFDGHHFLIDVAKKGAVAAIVKTGQSIPELICIEVSDTLKAYQQLANFHRNRYSIPVVAVTGSSGKTTTKEMIAEVLATKFKVLKTEKNFNNEIGLPKTLLQLTEEHEVCVVEMGMRGFGQIQELAAIAEPTIGVVTNVGTSHIEILGSQEGIARAKGELVEAINEEGTVILNEDDHWVKGMSKLTTGKLISYGIYNNATVTASNLRYKKDGIKFTCKCFDEIFDIFLPMIGEHNVYDALAAVAVARSLGLNSSKIKKALGDFPGIPMRQEIISLPNTVILNDTYNANPSSMQESVKALGQLEGKRKVAILGDMLELGDYAVKGHAEIGELLCAENYDIVFTYGKDSQNIAKTAKNGGLKKVFSFEDHQAIVEKYMELQQKGDIILVKGSRGMHMEEVVNKLRERLG